MDRTTQGGMGRREFIGAAAALIGAAALAAGCGDDTTGSGDGSLEGFVDAGGSPSHSHDVSITKEQLEAGEAVTLTLTGGGHTHTVELTGAEVQGLKAGTAHLSKTSSTTASHSHIVHLVK